MSSRLQLSSNTRAKTAAGYRLPVAGLRTSIMGKAKVEFGLAGRPEGTTFERSEWSQSKHTDTKGSRRF
jgi:hypothetical protein